MPQCRTRDQIGRRFLELRFQLRETAADQRDVRVCRRYRAARCLSRPFIVMAVLVRLEVFDVFEDFGNDE